VVVVVLENDVYNDGEIDKESTATATTGLVVAGRMGEANYAGSVRCHFILSTIIMDKGNDRGSYIKKKGPNGTFFAILRACPVESREVVPPWHIVSPIQ
jgi:hypothetical protein